MGGQPSAPFHEKASLWEHFACNEPQASFFPFCRSPATCECFRSEPMEFEASVSVAVRTVSSIDPDVEEKSEIEVEDGGKYSGQWKSNKRHGFGRLTLRD